MIQPLITSSDEFTAKEYLKFEMCKSSVDEYQIYLKFCIFKAFDDYSLLLVEQMKKKIYSLNLISSNKNMKYNDYCIYLNSYCELLEIVKNYVIYVGRCQM